VLIGTRFFATDEALGALETKQRIATSRAASTLRTRVFDIVRRLDWPEGFTGRAIGNEFTARWHGHEEELAANLADEHARYQAAVLRNDLSTVVVWAGRGIDAIAAVEPTSAVMARLVREAELTSQHGRHR
jgi:nitronate monooxygenase